MAEKNKPRFRRRILAAVWGAILGILLGTAASSALAPVVKTQWLKVLLVEGFKAGVPDFSTSLGFFSLTFGFSIRFTLLSGILMITIAALLLFLPFPEDKTR